MQVTLTIIKRRFMRGLIIFLVCLFHLSAYTQLLNNSMGEAFTDEPFFNIENIRANKIKRIKGHFSNKKINDQIRPSDLIYVYEFDKAGRLSQKYETVQVSGGIDTVVTQYEYDLNGFLKVKRRTDKTGFYAYVYEYDNSGRVIKEEFRRDMNKSRSKIDFLLDKEFLITYEVSTYENYPLQEKRTYFNSYDKPFQEKFSYYNEDGYLVEELEKLKVTSGQKKTTYSYNEKGLLSELEINSSIMGTSKVKYNFKYDSHANLISKEIYRNDEFTTEIQVVYNEKTGLISAILTKQVSTNFITILRLDEYEFYN